MRKTVKCIVVGRETLQFSAAMRTTIASRRLHRDEIGSVNSWCTLERLDDDGQFLDRCLISDSRTIQRLRPAGRLPNDVYMYFRLGISLPRIPRTLSSGFTPLD